MSQETLSEYEICLQLLTGLGALDYRQLNFLSLSSVSAATVVAFALPPIEKTVYFHRGGGELQAMSEEEPLQSGEGGNNNRTRGVAIPLSNGFESGYGMAKRAESRTPDQDPWLE